MRAALIAAILGTGLLLVPAAYAQTDTGVTAACKDGSDYSGKSRSGACRGHGGVASWGATTASATPAAKPANARIASASTPATTPSSTPSPSPTPSPLIGSTKPSLASAPATGPTGTTAPKAGGGTGQVWVNNTSKVYHCPGTRYYGKTKNGAYMAQSAAEAAGDRPSGGKACS
ncbi:DUF3761 domain-containing protein [Rhodopila sp.]|uniref:DUF3761 domain-containing protein n=1 Tax=Rhodopila sp. TaxID=2480087 RepID=UPI003D0D58A2